MTMGERVGLRLKELDKGPKWLGDQVGASVQAISQLIRLKATRSRYVAAMAVALDVHAAWLSDGKGPKLSVAYSPRPSGLDEPAPNWEDGPVDIQKAANEMMRAWHRLDERDRMQFKRAIETKALQHADMVPDQQLAYLSRPDRQATVTGTSVVKKKTRTPGTQ